MLTDVQQSYLLVERKTVRKRQFGFRKKRSKVDAIANLIANINIYLRYCSYRKSTTFILMRTDCKQ